MRSLFAGFAVLLFILAGCSSDESTVAAPDTVITETATTVVSTETQPASATIVELPAETTQTVVATQTTVTTQTAPATTPAPAAKTAATPAAKPATKTATPAAKPAAPAPAVTPAPVPAPQQQPAPVAKAPEPEPVAAKAPAPASKAPKTHNVDKEGVMHAPGMETPATKCAGCHGKDLKGGKVAPSCFSCHEQKWK